jgi:TonB family protein
MTTNAPSLSATRGRAGQAVVLTATFLAMACPSTRQATDPGAPGVPREPPREPAAEAPERLVARRIPTRNDEVGTSLIEIQRCYTTIGLLARPGLAGRVKVRFTILPDGSVGQIDLVETTLSHPPTERCILAAVKRWRFPKPEGQTPVVTYPFHFKPSD